MVRKTLPISIPSFDSGRRTSSFLNVVANLRNVFTKRSNSVSFFTLQNNEKNTISQKQLFSK